MATTGIFNGTSLVLSIDTDGNGAPTLLGASTSTTVSFSLDTFETTNKDDELQNIHNEIDELKRKRDKLLNQQTLRKSI